ncbi:MAG: hypothetical protein V3V96_01575 [Acidiferrobacterales bacterium]
MALQLIGADNYGQLEDKVIDIGKELAAKVLIPMTLLDDICHLGVVSNGLSG